MSIINNKSENENEYDPFNPTDSDVESDNRKEEEEEVVTTTTTDADSTTIVTKNNEVTSKEEAKIEIVSNETAIVSDDLERENKEVVEETIKNEVIKTIKSKSRSKSPTSRKNPTKKRSSSRSRATSKRSNDSKHRSKSRSKDRKKDKSHHRRHHSRGSHDRSRNRSKSKSKTIKNSKRSRSRSIESRKHKSKRISRSRSRSRSVNTKHSSSKSSINSKKDKRSRSKSQNNFKKTDNNSSKSTSSINIANSSSSSLSSLNKEADGKKLNPQQEPSNSTLVNNSNNKRSNLIQIQTQDGASKANLNKSSTSKDSSKNQAKSIADYLIEEMFNDEKQVKVDVDKIKLPDYVNQSSISKKDDIIVNSSIATNNAAVMNSNQIKSKPEHFANETKSKIPSPPHQQSIPIINNKKNSDDKSVVLSNELKFSSFIDSSFASSSSIASVSGAEGSHNNSLTVNITNNKVNSVSVDDDEPYDVEAEYKELDNRLNEFNKNNNVDLLSKLNNSLNDSSPTDLNKKNRKTVQDEIIDAAKQAIKPFYVTKKINKDDYKMIMKKVVNKCLRYSKDNKIDTNKVGKMVVGYVNLVRNETMKLKK